MDRVCQWLRSSRACRLPRAQVPAIRRNAVHEPTNDRHQPPLGILPRGAKAPRDGVAQQIDALRRSRRRTRGRCTGRHAAVDEVRTGSSSHRDDHCGQATAPRVLVRDGCPMCTRVHGSSVCPSHSLDRRSSPVRSNDVMPDTPGALTATCRQDRGTTSSMRRRTTSPRARTCAIGQVRKLLERGSPRGPPDRLRTPARTPVRTGRRRTGATCTGSFTEAQLQPPAPCLAARATR